MKIVLQRVSKAAVHVEGRIVAEIGAGYVLLLGIASGDSQRDIEYLVPKISNMRLFENQQNKFDKSLIEVKGAVLIVSQFTLFADYSKGRRPFFGDAAEPQLAEELYNQFIKHCESEIGVPKVKSGVFAAKMDVSLVNDGPVTLVLNSR